MTPASNLIKLHPRDMSNAELEAAIDEYVRHAVDHRLTVGEAARFGRFLHEWSDRLVAANELDAIRRGVLGDDAA